jgi:glycerol-3-phosphate dehydrogenase
MNELSKERLRRLGSAPFDVLVIGGGIVGAGVARDAALRGLRTVLVDKSDFASGTSSRSSRLLHGGLRYLEQGRIGLVREASLEKMRLSRLAPHLCEPLPFVFPVWKGGPWGLWKLSAGVHLYDILCGGRNLGSSATLGPGGMLREVPGLRSQGLRGGVRYFDGLTNDARLVIDTLRSAEAAGAALLNYATLESADRIGSEWRCTLRDELSGTNGEVRARTVVNAAGAWAGGLAHSRVRLRLTKGAHLVARRSSLAVTQAVVLSEGRRILFVIPWGERVILGTTDTDYSGDPADVRTDAADIEYILGVVNDAFPQARLTPPDLISSWAGVRPLIASRRNWAGAPSDISRGHQIRVAEPGWIDVAGGKLTTYRLMAEQAVDRLGEFLRPKPPRSRTAQSPLAAEPDSVRFSGVLPPPFTQEVVRHCCRKEWVVHLDDLMLRRTSWHFYHANQGELAGGACGWMAEQLGWDGERKRSELQRYYRMAESIGARAGAFDYELLNP